MTGLVSMPRVDPPCPGAVDDSIKSCGSIGKAYRYCHGYGKPNHPVPAIPISVDWDFNDAEYDLSYVILEEWRIIDNKARPKVVACWAFPA